MKFKIVPICFSLISLFVIMQIDDSYAHPLLGTNDYIENAQTNTYLDGQENSGSLDVGDWDYWKYTIPDSGTLDIELESMDDVDSDWILFNQDAAGYDPPLSTQINYSHQTGLGGDENLYNINVSPGEYYLKVYSPNNGAGNYILRSLSTSSSHPEVGTNDYKLYADNALLNGSNQGGTLGSGDWDYWKYEFPDPGYIDIELDSGYNVDIDWELITSSNTVMSSSRNAEYGGSENKYNIEVEGETYFLRVYLRDGTIGTGSYILRNSFTPSQKETRIINFDNKDTFVGVPVEFSAQIQAKNIFGFFTDIEDGLSVHFYIDENLNGFDDDSIICGAATSGGIAACSYTPMLTGTFPIRVEMAIQQEYDFCNAEASLTVHPLIQSSISIENVSGGAVGLEGIWRCEIYDSSMNSIKEVFSPNPENISVDLPSGSLITKIFFLFDDGQGIWEFWGEYDTDVSDTNKNFIFVRNQPWLSSISPGQIIISNTETFKITSVIQNELDIPVEVIVEAKISNGNLANSNPVNIPAFSNANVELYFYSNLPDSGNWPLHYWIKTKEEESLSYYITDHSSIPNYLNVEYTPGPNSTMLFMDYQDRNGDLWQLGVDFNDASNDEWYYEPKTTFQNLKVYKNEIETQPDMAMFQALNERIARQFDAFYPNIMIGTDFDENLGIWANPCGFSWACGLAKINLNDGDVRKEKYKEAIWEAITCRNHPFLNQEVQVPVEGQNQDYYTSGIPLKLISYIDSIYEEQIGSINDIYEAADHVKKIQKIAFLVEQNPSLKLEIESESASLGKAIDCLKIAHLIGDIQTHVVKNIVLMDFLATTEWANNRLSTLKEAYWFIKNPFESRVDSEIINAIEEVEIELENFTDSLSSNIISSFLTATDTELNNSEFLRNKLIEIAVTDISKSMARNIAKNLKISPKTAASFTVTILTDVINGIITVHDINDKWEYIISSGMLSKVVTNYAQNSQDWKNIAYPENALMTHTLLQSHKIRDVYDLQSVFAFEYLSNGLSLVESDWMGVLQDAIDSTFTQATSPPYAYPINYASTAVKFGAQVGIAANQLIYSDSLEASRDMLLYIVDAAEMKSRGLNEWAEMFAEIADAPLPSELVEIEISGATQVDEQSIAQYTCTAHFSDGRTEDVTLSANWTENHTSTSIDQNGLLTTDQIAADIVCRITAFYEGKTDTYDVTVIASPCVYGLSPTSALFPYTGGASIVDVTSEFGCLWEAFSSDSWITINSGSSGNGNGIVDYSVSSNQEASLRVGTLTIAGNTFTVTQDGVSCSYNISPNSENFDSSSHNSSVSVTAPDGCNWNATTNASWIQITSGSTGSGNGAVSYSISSNSNTSMRTDTMTIAGEIFTVTQEGIFCSYSIFPDTENYSSSGGSSMVSVITQNGCTWTATSNDSWIIITSGNSGSGSSTVNYSVSSHSSPSTRTGTINIAGKTFTVSQDGITCGYSISPSSENFGGSGGIGNIEVSAPDGCSWNAVANDPWLIITFGSNGVGNGTTIYTVNENPDSNQRSGTIAIAGETFSVTQLEAAADYHSGDYNPADWTIDESEMQRLVQLYQAGSYHCDSNEDDGYGTGPGDQSCKSHSSDYYPADWKINLSELLRAIQIHNLGGYIQDPAGEDGYKPNY